MSCHDCDRGDDQGVELYLVAADFGDGAFLHVLCTQCEHRRWYRGQLRARQAAARANTFDDKQKTPSQN